MRSADGTVFNKNDRAVNLFLDMVSYLIPNYGFFNLVEDRCPFSGIDGLCGLSRIRQEWAYV